MIVELLAYFFVFALLLSTLSILYAITRFFFVWIRKKTDSIDFNKKKD